jgi:hypothetical protein
MSTANMSVAGPSTTLSSTSSATVRYSDVWNVAAQYRYVPNVDQATIVIKPSDNCFIRMATPSEALTMNGTLTLQELGLG